MAANIGNFFEFFKSFFGQDEIKFIQHVIIFNFACGQSVKNPGSIQLSLHRQRHETNIMHFILDFYDKIVLYSVQSLFFYKNLESQ